MAERVSTGKCAIRQLLHVLAGCGTLRPMKAFAEQMSEFDARRRAARVTYRDLARITGIQPANLSRYRNHVSEPSLSQWVKLNNALDAIIAERVTELRQLA